MPKTIKKRIAKPGQSGQDDVMDFLGRLRDTAATRQRQVIIAVAAVVAIIVVVLAIYISHTNMVRKAQQLEDKGYQAYAGLYDYSALSPKERAQKALELFTQAYKVRKTPFSLLYMANSQYELGDYNAAASTADQVIREFPGNAAFVPVARMKKAAALMAAGEKDKALETLNDISINEGSPLADTALYEAATLLEGMGRKDEAKAKFEDLVKKYPDSPYAAQAMQKVGLGPNGSPVKSAGKIEVKPGKKSGKTVVKTGSKKAAQKTQTSAGGISPAELGIK